MSIQRIAKLNTGAIIPLIGLGILVLHTLSEPPADHVPSLHLIFSGTWKSSPGDVGRAVETALKNGYKHIDTASGYGQCTE
jgi:diketogulonate reductase-like aldo/keto reductase